MATATSDPQTQPDQHSTFDQAAIKIGQQIAGIEIAHRAVMLDDMSQVLAINRQLAAQHNQRTMGASMPNNQPPQLPPQDDGMINVGDTHNYYPAPIQVPAAQPAAAMPAATTAPAASLLSKALPYVLTALAAGGVPAGYLLSQYLAKPAAAVVSPAVDQATQDLGIELPTTNANDFQLEIPGPPAPGQQ